MKRILIAEDNEVTSRAIRNVLDRNGFETNEVTNGRDALEMLQKEHYDLLIADLILPYVNGMELVDRIKTDVSLRDLKIIIVTGVDNEATVQDAFKLGVDEYLLKPIEPKILVNRAAALTRSSQPARKSDTRITDY